MVKRGKVPGAEGPLITLYDVNIKGGREEEGDDSCKD